MFEVRFKDQNLTFRDKDLCRYPVGSTDSATRSISWSYIPHNDEDLLDSVKLNSLGSLTFFFLQLVAHVQLSVWYEYKSIFPDNYLIYRIS